MKLSHHSCMARPTGLALGICESSRDKLWPGVGEYHVLDALFGVVKYFGTELCRDLDP